MRRALNVNGELSEAAFQAQVVGLARFYDWRVFHAPANRPAGKSGRPQRMVAPESTGFPDLVLVRDSELLFVELKTDKGRLGPGQQDWLDALQRVAVAVDDAVVRLIGLPGAKQPPPVVEALLWRPRDWEILHIRLARGRVKQTHAGVGA